MINFTHLYSISNIYEFKSNQKQFKSNHYKFESKYKSNPTKVLLTACYSCRPRELTGSVGVTGTRKRKTEISTVWNQVVTIKYLDKNIRYYCTERKESYISVCWYLNEDLATPLSVTLCARPVVWNCSYSQQHLHPPEPGLRRCGGNTRDLMQQLCLKR